MGERQKQIELEWMYRKWSLGVEQFEAGLVSEEDYRKRWETLWDEAAKLKEEIREQGEA